MWITLDRFDTGLFADAVDWYPAGDEPVTQDLLACATYQLFENSDGSSSSDRRGGLHLLKPVPRELGIDAGSFCDIDPADDPEMSNWRLDVVDAIQDIPGVLDMKWVKLGTEQVALCTADARGDVRLYKVEAQDDGRRENRVGDPENADPVLKLAPMSSEDTSAAGVVDGMALYVDVGVGTGGDAGDFPVVAVSSTKGTVTVFNSTPSGAAGENGSLLDAELSFQAHEHEAWVVHFDRNRRDLIFSGGDDCCLRSFDLRCPPKVMSDAASCWRRANGGVTSILTHPEREFEVLAGSYDETLYVFDRRSWRRELDTLALGGGVWRLAWHPERSDLLAVAAMHAGFFVVRRGGGSSSAGCDDDDDGKSTDGRLFSVVAGYAGHDSLAYGVGWRGGKRLGGDLLATCSFYDHALHLSRFSES